MPVRQLIEVGQAKRKATLAAHRDGTLFKAINARPSAMRGGISEHVQHPRAPLDGEGPPVG
ncbi:hypothetical protein Raf01_71670 [Rugosimonospora africana]|uniref:Uncharacterized protein n=1 Tax=Rugosimonospora africana TaxID=556532 RepID=A0A8J3R097_9ACTN|nr:hypothetical protein Raf01_71670 [Rugosimonospora africana]